MNPRQTILCSLSLLFLLFGCQHKTIIDNTPRHTQALGFIYLSKGHFALNDTAWFPLMLNYKMDWSATTDSFSDNSLGRGTHLIPAAYYGEQSVAAMDRHFGMISQAGFNTMRVCIDVVNRDTEGYFFGPSATPLYLMSDSLKIFSSIDLMLTLAERHQLRVMLLLKAPLDTELTTFVSALMRHCASCPTLFAYDLMNEPLYFDPTEMRDKMEAYRIVDGWRQLMNKYAPNQLFTIGFAEPIEVFEWDPSILPVDFVEMHTYHPLRMANEMYWYGRYCGKPWMVGETALPSDGDTIGYEWQSHYMTEAYNAAVKNGAIGFGWWEFADYPEGVNLEAQHSGLFALGTDKVLHPKPSLQTVATLLPPPQPGGRNKYSAPPANYYNILDYHNIALKGMVVDKQTGKPIEGAVIRGWNNDWSVGINTFSNTKGRFTLFSNDVCTHFEVSAPGYSHQKFDNSHYPIANKKHKVIAKVDLTLPDSQREYQQIPLLYPSTKRSFLPSEALSYWRHATYSATMERIELERL